MNDNGSDRLAAVEAALTALQSAVQSAVTVLSEMSAAFQRQALDTRMSVLEVRMAEIAHDLRTHSHKAA